MTIKTRRQQLAPQTHYSLAFGLYDEKGRECGVTVYQREVEFIPVGDEQCCYYTREPGCYLEVRVQPTRNGVSYGAWQREVYFSGEVAAMAHISRLTASTRKRYAKKYGAAA